MSLQYKTKFLDETIDYESISTAPLHVFILVNSRSGSWLGQQFIRKQNQILIHHNNRAYNFSFCDLYSREKREACFKAVNQLCEDGETVRIVISGGDGTMEWVLSLSIHHRINFEKVVFSVLPIGTGNDFARSIGWGDFQFSYKKLQSLAAQLQNCLVGCYDIWECNVSCYHSGKITQIKNGMEKQIIGKSLKNNFSNYFGVGTDARISYFAQKINAKSVFLKKISYGFAWIASLFSCSQKIAKSLSSFTGASDEPQNPLKSTRQLQLSNNINFLVNQNMKCESQIELHQKDSCITFLNSTSSMELNHIWKTPYLMDSNKIYKSQKVDDGTIEIVSYRNQISLLLQRTMHMAKKVAQGSGPFLLKFKQPQKGKKQYTYIHINGEPYRVENVKEIKISRSTRVPSGKIKVLVRGK